VDGAAFAFGGFRETIRERYDDDDDDDSREAEEDDEEAEEECFDADERNARVEKDFGAEEAAPRILSLCAAMLSH